MGDDHVLARILSDAGLRLLRAEVRPREGRAWLVGRQGTCGVLRQLPVSVVSGAVRLQDVAWLHGFLTRLAGLGFPSPRPLRCLDGKSWTIADGLIWEFVSFLPGHTIGWSAIPPMEEVGALLGRYHATVQQIDVTSQRPDALPLADVPAVLLSRKLDVVPPEERAVIRQLAAQLACDLDGTGHMRRERVVIHGDFTNDNVIADGTPPRATGVIDFANAHVETPLADVGYGLWRSGRPHERADDLDFSRARRFLRGYASIVPLSPDQASIIPVYLRGRGLQMIAKRVRAGRNETGMLAQVQWLSANASAIGDALAAAVP
ncbi:MAG TPA: phosphotransferase [Pseudonocardiaceae bacterium]|nr:phosphotransferase [Pseudonocardiaceae bacterium]